jgi:hypothetical protein
MKYITLGVMLWAVSMLYAYVFPTLIVYIVLPDVILLSLIVICAYRARKN